MRATLSLTGTAVVARYDPASGVLSWARGGHLPPLLARAGTAVELSRPRGLLLGADPAATYGVATDRLQAGDLVLFYTDGLVERRSPAPCDRLDQVMRRLSAVSATPGDDPLPRLRGVLHCASPDDDTCTLAVHVLP